MKYYHSIGPSPGTAKNFITEKGINIEIVSLDLIKGENRQATHLQRNPLGQLPVLELDDGTIVTESIAVCGRRSRRCSRVRRSSARRSRSGPRRACGCNA